MSTDTSRMGRAALVLLAFSILVAVLALSLRPDSFFVGDPGIKFVSARNALRYPGHPLNIPLPRLGGEPVPHVESFFAVHGDHSHAVTSEVFPLISAPLLATLGPRGLYVLPALGFLGTLAACAWLASVLDQRRSAAVVMAVAGLGTPFLFYGLEFWEHMPALALGTAGAALLLKAARDRPGRASAAGPTCVAGLLLGLATVLRPEAICFAAAVMFASRALVHRPAWRSLALAAAGIGVALLPLEIYTLVHFGSLVPGHVGANAGLVANSWSATRLQLAGEWLLPSLWNAAGPINTASLWSVAPAAIVGAIAMITRADHGERSFLAIATALTIALVVLFAPNDGGGQWGPRYLLFACVPLAILAADLVARMRRGALTIAVLLLALAACVWVQRAAYRQLRGAKASYGRLVDFVVQNVEPGTIVVTDLWWLDQLAAPALDPARVLFAGDPHTGQNIVQRLSDTSVPSVTVFRSREESPDVDGWSAPTCYFEEAREELSVRGVVAVRLRHRCGYKP